MKPLKNKFFMTFIHKTKACEIDNNKKKSITNVLEQILKYE